MVPPVRGEGTRPCSLPPYRGDQCSPIQGSIGRGGSRSTRGLLKPTLRDHTGPLTGDPIQPRPSLEGRHLTDDLVGLAVWSRRHTPLKRGCSTAGLSGGSEEMDCQYYAVWPLRTYSCVPMDFILVRKGEIQRWNTDNVGNPFLQTQHMPHPRSTNLRGPSTSKFHL